MDQNERLVKLGRLVPRIPGHTQVIERGTVTRFFSEPERCFGFVEVTLGERHTVFFHVKNGGAWQCDGGDEPVFSPSVAPPHKGNVIEFSVVQGNKGPTAHTWWYPMSFDRALEAIENRKTYRFMKREGKKPRSRLFNYGDDTYRINPLWEGKDLNGLRLVCPKRWGFEVCNREMRELWFEVQTPNGWERCGDPR